MSDYYAGTSKRRGEIAELFAKAFENTEYPGDDNIEISPNELPRLRGAWKEVDPYILTVYRHELRFLSDEGLAYYLPAFVLHLLLRPAEADTLVDSLPFDLSPYRSPEQQSAGDTGQRVLQHLNRVYSLLNDEQRQCVLLFLREYTTIFPDFSEGIPPRIQDALEVAITFWAGKLAEG